MPDIKIIRVSQGLRGATGATGATGAQGPAGEDGAAGIVDIVEDTTPQLGGDLDANGNWVTFDTTTGIQTSSNLGDGFNKVLEFRDSENLTGRVQDSYWAMYNNIAHGALILEAQNDAGHHTPIMFRPLGGDGIRFRWIVDGATTANYPGFEILNIHAPTGAVNHGGPELYLAVEPALADRTIGDIPGAIYLKYGPEFITCFLLTGALTDVTDGSEDFICNMETMVAGSSTKQLSLASGVYVGNSEGPFDGAGTLTVKNSVRAYAATAIPAGGTTGAGLKVSSTSNFGVFFGSGAPTLSAAKGSLYLRSDGSTTNDRMYVNTDGGTTWTAVITAA